jgi:ubiquinone/menaquinone biosynthesis C-methylase UbiE
VNIESMTDKADTAARFSKQADAYAKSPGHAFGNDLDILAAYAEPGLYHLCLDVATGPGHTAFRLAAKASLVVGIDIAEGMLARARKLATERQVENVIFKYGDATDIPFGPDTFDLVTCRIAPHHFNDIPGFLREVGRVLRPGGRFVLEDSMAPDEPEVCAFLHWLEVTRDPSHARSLTRDEWRHSIEAAGLTINRETIYNKEHDFADWLARMDVSKQVVDEITQRILTAPAELRSALFAVAGDSVTLLRDRKLILRADKRL